MKGKMDSNDGIAYVAALAMMIIFLSLALTYGTLRRSEYNVAKIERDQIEALFIAESGMEHALADLKNGGTGEVFGDIDSNAETDYTTSINWSTNTIRAEKVASLSLGSAISRIEAGVTQEFASAFHVAGNIGVAATMGTVNGNVVAGGTIDTNINNLVDPPYVATPGVSGLTIPSPDLAEYANSANFANHTTLPDCTALGFTPPDGVYYITGDCVIDGMSILGPFTLNGTLVVDGNLTMNQILVSTTITPSGDDPAIVVNGDFTGISLRYVTFDGAVYAGGSIDFTTFAFNTIVNGPIIAGVNLDFTNVPSLLLNYDPSVTPPYFTKGGDYTVSSWKGHLTSP